METFPLLFRYNNETKFVIMKKIILALLVLISFNSFSQNEIEIYKCAQSLKDSTSARLEIEIINDSSAVVIYHFAYRLVPDGNGGYNKKSVKQSFYYKGVYNPKSKSILCKSAVKQMQNTYTIRGGYILDHDDIYNESMTFYVLDHHFEDLAPTMDMEESIYYD